MLLLLLTVLVIYVTMVYGPIAAWLVELFPDAHPLHVDVAAVSHRQRMVRWLPAYYRVAMVAATGNIYQGLWYPIVVAAMTLVIGTFFLRETKDVDICESRHNGRVNGGAASR